MKVRAITCPLNIHAIETDLIMVIIERLKETNKQIQIGDQEKK